MIWYVMDGDYDSSWVTAVYESEALANEHVRRCGGLVYSETVLSEVTVEDRSAAMAAEAEQSRRQHVERREREEAADALRMAQRIENQRNPRLCHCRTFSSDNCFITPHGYCGYCGGWTPEVFRAHKGEAALMAQIDLLAHHDRVKMRALVGVPPRREEEDVLRATLQPQPGSCDADQRGDDRGSSWQPIETAPRSQTQAIILGFAPDEEDYTLPSREGVWSGSLNCWVSTLDPNWAQSPTPTHWMPLPAPPEVK